MSDERPVGDVLASRLASRGADASRGLPTVQSCGRREDLGAIGGAAGRRLRDRIARREVDRRRPLSALRHADRLVRAPTGLGFSPVWLIRDDDAPLDDAEIASPWASPTRSRPRLTPARSRPGRSARPAVRSQPHVARSPELSPAPAWLRRAVEVTVQATVDPVAGGEAVPKPTIAGRRAGAAPSSSAAASVARRERPAEARSSAGIPRSVPPAGPAVRIGPRGSSRVAPRLRSAVASDDVHVVISTAPLPGSADRADGTHLSGPFVAVPRRHLGRADRIGVRDRLGSDGDGDRHDRFPVRHADRVGRTDRIDRVGRLDSPGRSHPFVGRTGARVDAAHPSRLLGPGPSAVAPTSLTAAAPPIIEALASRGSVPPVKRSGRERDVSRASVADAAGTATETIGPAQRGFATATARREIPRAMRRQTPTAEPAFLTPVDATINGSSAASVVVPLERVTARAEATTRSAPPGNVRAIAAPRRGDARTGSEDAPDTTAAVHAGAGGLGRACAGAVLAGASRASRALRADRYAGAPAGDAQPGWGTLDRQRVPLRSNRPGDGAGHAQSYGTEPLWGDGGVDPAPTRRRRAGARSGVTSIARRSDGVIRRRATSEVQTLADAAPIVADERHSAVGRIVGEAARVARGEVRAARAPSTEPELLTARVVSAVDRPRRDEVARRRRAAVAAERLQGRSPSPTAGQEAAVGRLSRLADKLVGLVHLVEADRRDDEAKRRVRRSTEAPAPAAADPQPASTDDGVSLDVLRRDVLAAVRSELQQAHDRAVGGSHADVWW